jgi:hypothetical protein
VLTFDGRKPWVPVTMDEYLVFEERRLARAVAETDRNIADATARTGQYDDSGPRQVYEAMKRTNPAEAEKFWAMIQGLKAQAARDAAAVAAAPAHAGFLGGSDARIIAAWRAARRGRGAAARAIV